MLGRLALAALAAFSVAALCVFAARDDAAPAEPRRLVTGGFFSGSGCFFPLLVGAAGGGHHNFVRRRNRAVQMQEGQDKWADEHVFRRRAGVFVDLGCYDGITYSNTWYFERVLGGSVCAGQPRRLPADRLAGRPRVGVQVGVGAAGKLPFVTAFMRSSLNASAVDYDFLASQGVGAGERSSTSTPGPPRRPPAGRYARRRLREHRCRGRGARGAEGVAFDRYCVDVFNIENEPRTAPSTLPRCAPPRAAATSTACASASTRSAARRRARDAPLRRSVRPRWRRRRRTCRRGAAAAAAAGRRRAARRAE